MRLFFDTNVLVAAVTRDTDRSNVAVDCLNEADDPYVSVLNLMELRSVLAKKNSSNATGSRRSSGGSRLGRQSPFRTHRP